MSELTEIKELLEKHRNESNEWRMEISKSIVKIETNYEYTKEKLEEVEKLKTAHNWQKGFIYALGLLGLAGIEEYFRNLINRP